ncbi:MAG: PilZ domain-containing protein [Rhodanobacter sp.]|nr:MAG: PilZ domain-containing protein [Rhodanobacter sp.]TAM08268.1 MAG: PilZ domain-containing protein [Rhodanobacter sp.]TAM37115.1 MAG: PilZ domain-containing protein [Rhodanobacter sp.]
MNTDTWDAFEQRLSSDESLHADAEPLPWPPTPERLQQLVDRNATVLTTLATLEERRVDTGDDDDPLTQEMRRMDAKLTALVAIVNQLLAPVATLPPRCNVRFNEVGAVVPQALVPAADGLLLRLRFDACPSLSLELPGQPVRDLGDGRVFVSFVTQGDALGDAISRLVFRHHRRKVADARQQAF